MTTTHRSKEKSMRRKLWKLILPCLMIGVLVLSACTPMPPSTGTPAEDATAEDAPAEAAPAADVGAVQIPEIEEGKFNVAFVFVGPIGDGGWTYAHNQGRIYLEENGDFEIDAARHRS